MPFIFLAFTFFIFTFYSKAESVNSTVDPFNGDFQYIEGNKLAASLALNAGTIDNFLRENKDKKSTGFLSAKPQVFVQSQFNENLFQFKASLNYLNFDEFSEDDHNNLSLLAKYHLRLASNQKVFFTGHFQNDYEYRGTGNSLGNGSSLEQGDESQKFFANAGYLYGHEQSIAKAKFLIGHREFSYETREEITKGLNLTSNYIQGNFDYLISGNTYSSTKVQIEDIDYEFNDSLSRQQYSMLTGIAWQSSALTELHLLLGFEKAVFSALSLPDEDAFIWQANLKWSPIDSTRINFSSGRTIKSSNKLEDSISVVDFYDISVNYDFTERVQLSTLFKILNEDINLLTAQTVEDSLLANVTLNYDWRDWLSVFVKYDYNDFDSPMISNTYELSVLSLGFTVTI
ncbi:MAG: outer membrane beta-barrel protein [Colwellia sp.]